MKILERRQWIKIIEERVSELEYKLTEIIQSEQKEGIHTHTQKKKLEKKIIKASGTYLYNKTKKSNILGIVVS